MTTFLAKSLLKPHEPSWVIMSNYITIKQSRSDPKNLIIRGHHLIKSSRILILEKLLSKELYHTLISIRANKVTPVTYFGTKCNANNLDWTKIFILPRLTTYNTYLRSFQYKILHNILFLNKKLFLWNNKEPTVLIAMQMMKHQYICLMNAILSNIYGYN